MPSAFKLNCCVIDSRCDVGTNNKELTESGVAGPHYGQLQDC